MTTPERRILLTPGPATTTDTVKRAQVVPDICPRESEFAAMVQGIAADLTRLTAAPEDARCVLFAGSGTAAVEAMVNSFAGENGLIVVDNGAYGARILQIARGCRIPALEFRSSPTAPIDLAALESLLAGRPKGMDQLAIVHHETTSGLLNDLAAVGGLCRRHGVELLVDAISSYGAIAIDMEGMNVAALAATSNKNLQAMPGASFLIARRGALDAARQRPRRGFYLDAVAEHDHFAAQGQMRFTAPVQTLYALRQAIDEILAEGVAMRLRRYERSWQTLIDGLAARGFAPVVPRQHQSRLITAVDAAAIPGFSFDGMHDFLLARGYTIYPGKLSGRDTFRVANIGDITYRDIEAFLVLVDEYLATCRK